MENNYQLSRIHNYVNGLMAREDMHVLEREALDDPFLQDAIDGYAMQQGVDAKQLSLLQKRLASRVEEQTVVKNRRFYSWQRLTVGLAAAVMFVAVSILLLIKYLPQQKAGLAEVEIMSDHISEIIVLPSEATAGSPQMGWEGLNDFISKHMHAGAEEGLVVISLKIDAKGKAYDIEAKSGDGFSYKDELVELLEKQVTWQGEHAQFSVDFRKINL